MKLTLIATLTFGLEAIVKRELIHLGFDGVKASDGKVEFQATAAQIPHANLWLRAADRVLLKMGQFPATTFEELFQQTKALPWEEWIPPDGHFPVLGKAVKSQLGSYSACQSIVKKAIVERLKEKHHLDWFPETGPTYTVQIAMYKDVATLTIDTTGKNGLHKRGYRLADVAAPLKETMASALVQLSFYQPHRLLIDPMCGSGTILIEAAMQARNIAPGLHRTFASEQWPRIPAEAWHQARQAAQAAINHDLNLQLFGYDIDATAVKTSRQNAQRAGVANDITFAQKDIRDLWIDQQHGLIISNPPYGMRMMDYTDLNQIYISLHKTFRKKWGWSLFILTADKKFPDYFKRAKPNRTRKLYNGTIEVRYYQYHGRKPTPHEQPKP